MLECCHGTAPVLRLETIHVPENEVQGLPVG